MEYVLRGVKISVEFVNARFSSKGIGMVRRKISFLYKSVTIEDREKVQLVESIYADKLLYLIFFYSHNCLNVIG